MDSIHCSSSLLILFIPSGTCGYNNNVHPQGPGLCCGPIFCSSIISVCRPVVFGLPGFLLLGGVHLRATLRILSLGILGTCPSHLSRRRLVSMTALLQPVFLWSSTLDILLGQNQNIRQIFLKHHCYSRPYWYIIVPFTLIQDYSLQWCNWHQFHLSITIYLYHMPVKAVRELQRKLDRTMPATC